MAAFDWSKNSTNQKQMQIHRPMATHVLPRFRQINWLIWFFTLTHSTKMYSDKPIESKNSKEKLTTDCHAMVNLKIQAKFLSSPKP